MCVCLTVVQQKWYIIATFLYIKNKVKDLCKKIDKFWLKMQIYCFSFMYAYWKG